MTRGARQKFGTENFSQRDFKPNKIIYMRFSVFCGTFNFSHVYSVF